MDIIIGNIKKLVVRITIALLVLIVILVLQNVLDYYGMFDQNTSFSQPYHVGDSLIYQIDEHINDTLVISSITKRVNPDNPLSVYPKWEKTTFICANSSKGIPKEIMRIEISKSDKMIVICDFFDNKDTSFRFAQLYLDLNNKVYKDFQDNKDCTLKIEELQYANDEDPNNYRLKQINWSGTYGFLYFIFGNNKQYKLISFIHDGVRHNF